MSATDKDDNVEELAPDTAGEEGHDQSGQGAPEAPPSPQQPPAPAPAPAPSNNNIAPVEQLMAPYRADLEKTGPAAPKIRKVLKALHDADPHLLNSDQYPDIKKYLKNALVCSPALVDKSKKEVLEVVASDASDEPSFPQEPAGGQAKAPQVAAATTTATAGGAPFGGALHTATTQEGEADAEDEPMVWDSKKVGVMVATGINLGSWILPEWVRVTKEEREELGKIFLDTFKETFPTKKKAGHLMFSLAALEGVLMPRVSAVIDHRFKHKDLQEVKKKAMDEIKEAHTDAKQ